MADDALIAWLGEGAPVALSSEADKQAAAAKRHTDFSQRFFKALHPADDLGPTQEDHELAVAQLVYAVHVDLCACGDEDYDAVWWLLNAPTRAALKAYIAMAKSERRAT